MAFGSTLQECLKQLCYYFIWLTVLMPLLFCIQRCYYSSTLIYLNMLQLQQQQPTQPKLPCFWLLFQIEEAYSYVLSPKIREEQHDFFHPGIYLHYKRGIFQQKFASSAICCPFLQSQQFTTELNLERLFFFSFLKKPS